MPELIHNNKGIQFKTSTPEKLTKILPEGSYIVKPNHLILAHNVHSWQLLSNLKLVDAKWHPVETYCTPKVNMAYDMYPHAKTTLKECAKFKRGFILNEARLGKTSSMIAVADFLQQQGVIDSVLIVAPLSTLHSVWVKEIRGMLPHKTIGVLHHKSKTGYSRREYAQQQLDAKKNLYIINPDGVKLMLDVLIKAKKDGHFKCVFIDESTEFANHTTQKWKAMSQLVLGLEYFYMATATPGDPEQVYGQARMMNPNSVPKNKMVWKMQTMTQLNKYKWVVKADAEDKIQTVLSPAVRFKKRDVWKDLPNEMIIPFKVDLPPQSTNLIKILKEDQGAIINGVEVKLANAGVVAGKLAQIASGTIILDKDTATRLPIQDKIGTVIQWHGESEGKTIIFASFTETINYIADELEAKGITTAIVDGSVSGHRRGEIFSQFQNENDPQILVAHVKTVSYGVELAAADKIVFWGPPRVKAFLYQQAKERLFSSHQKSEQPVIYQMYSLYTEKMAFKNLDAGVEWQVGVTEALKYDLS